MANDDSNANIAEKKGPSSNAYLSPLSVIALSFGYAVGWGAFVLPGTNFLPNAGPVGTLIGLLIGAVAIIVLAFNFHKLTAVRNSGGTYGYVTKIFGHNHGFLVGWFLFLTYVAILWANATALILLARYLFGGTFQFGFHYTMVGFDVYFGEVLLSLAAIVSCAVACILGKRLAIRLHTIFAFVLIAGVAICFVAALLGHHGGTATMAPAFSTGSPAAVQVLRILAIVPWAFVGFEAVFQSSSEFRFPVRRTFPLLIAAILLSLLTYVLLLLLPVLALPEGFPNWKDYIDALPGLKGIAAMPVFSAARKALGPLGVAVIGGSMLSAQLTAIFATYIAVSRLVRSMSDDDMIPGWLGRCNREGTPVNAILTVMCLSVPIPFFGRTVIDWPVALSNLGAALAYGYISAAALALVRKNREDGHFFEKAAGVFGLAMSVVFILLMLAPKDLSGNSLSAESYLLLIFWCFVGLLLYRRVFIRDTRGKFGNSTLVWITVLIVIFFSSLMWFRLAVYEAAKIAHSGFIGKTVTAETVRESLSEVNVDMLIKSAIEIGILLFALGLILNLFSVLHKREKNLILEKLKAEESANQSKNSLLDYQISNQKLAEANRELTEYSKIIEAQRKREAELREELEKKQNELEAALQAAQAAYNEKTTALTDLEDASELARLASFHYDFDTHIRTGSKLVSELWPDDENGRALLEEDFVYPEDIPLFKQNVKALLEKKSEDVQFSFRVGTSPDDLRHYRMKLSLDPCKPNSVTGIVQDVTELAESMLKLKDTQALWDAAINSIPIMFTVKDIDDGFRYLLCNKAFAETFNLRPDEIVGKTDRDIFHDDTTLGFADRINIPTTGTDGLTEIEGELPDGSGDLRYIKTVMRVFEDASGHRLLLAAANDITDMNRLLRNRGVINRLLEDIIGEEDFDLCIQRTLETICKILGASRACLIRHEEEGTKAHCVAEYVEPTHAHASFRMLDRTLSRVRGVLENTDDKRTFICNDIASFDWKNSNEDWHRAALALDLRAIFLSNIVCDGEVRGTVGFNFEGIDHTFSNNDIPLLRVTAHIIEVILARRHAQTLIMDALAKAQAAAKAKSFFIASVSHEIRTPLNSVIGFAELLREGGVSPKQQKEYLDAISTSANALLMLINDVLDLSKLEANQMQIITAFTDFNALCREVMLIFTFRVKENGNTLVYDVPEDLPELDIDNIRIRQILINLFGNAVKFTKNGTITLHVSFTPDPGPADTGTLRCAVSDTGIGISEEDQKKLMEPFVQLSGMRGTNAVNNGTGLGLSISKRLAVCMNGELTCTSRIGEGSTFAVTLNSVRYRAKTVQVRPPSKSGPGTAALACGTKPIRILIVDDVSLNLHVAKALFNRIGFNDIFTAKSGKEALELLGRQPIDLILSDMWMPEMSGSELSAEVKRDPRFAHIPIVAQTADVETNGNFDMSHFDAVILKPLTKEKLSNMVKRIFEDGDLPKGEGGTPFNLG